MVICNLEYYYSKNKKVLLYPYIGTIIKILLKGYYMKRFFILVSLLFLGFTTVNGMSITQIKKVFKEIERNKSHYSINKTEYNDDGFGESKITYKDRNGVIRKLILEYGSDDSYHKGEYYYTRNGELFFTYLEDSNIAGCTTERRYYISRHRVIKQLKKIKKCSILHAYPIKIYKPWHITIPFSKNNSMGLEHLD